MRNKRNKLNTEAKRIVTRKKTSVGITNHYRKNTVR